MICQIDASRPRRGADPQSHDRVIPMDLAMRAA
jgi:hypothetical protein